MLDSHRIKKTEWIESLQEYQTIIYVYSGLDVVYEKNLNTNQQATYVYGTTGRTDIQYKPFGESTVNGEEFHLYTGKEKDETGLYYYGA